MPAGVRMKAGIVYASPGGRDLRLDLFLPDGNGPFPAVVYIHGGGWSGGSTAQFQKQAVHMAAKGFAGACIQYRLSGEAKFPAALHDSKAAVRWVRANAAQYRIDANRIGAAGGSAGGHLVAMLGTTPGIAELDGTIGNTKVPTVVQAVAAFNPALDFVAFGKRGPDSAQNAVSRFLGTTYRENPELWAKAAPLTHVTAKAPPFLFLHGSADSTVPYQQSVDMAEKLKAAGVTAEIFTAPGAAHGFFNRDPWFQPTLEKMEAFFRTMLR
jgi:acetyl esterase/lipase